MTVHCKTGIGAPPNRNQKPPSAQPTVVAVDAGGTWTRAGWFAADGRCLGVGRAAGGNPISRGAEAAAAQLAVALAAAAGPAGRFAGPTRPRVAVLAMAGGSRSDDSVVRTELLELGVDGDLVMASDLLAGYLSAALEPAGYGLVAGTGAAAIRVADGVEEAVVDGVGWLLGDRGSGFWIGLRTVQATMRALDRRGRMSALAEAVLAEQGIPSAWPGPESRHPAVIPLVRATYDAAPVELARYARVAIRVAATGDPEATAIVRAAVGELLATVGDVLEPSQPGPIVLSGGVARALPGLPDALADLQRAHGWVPDVRPAADGLLGAAVLGLRALGISVSDPVYDRMRVGLAEWSTAR